MFAGAVGDEELGTVCVLAFVRHAYHTAGVMRERSVELVCEVFIPDRAATLACSGRVAALEHEVADVSVEHDAVIVSLLT